MRLLICAAVLMTPTVAWADQAVRFEAVALELRVPDDWTVSKLADGDGYEMVRPGPVRVASVTLARDVTCDEVLTEFRETERLPIGQSAQVSSAWSGYGFGENNGFYCRDVQLDGVAYMIGVFGKQDELGKLATVVDEALDRGITTRVTGGADHDVRFYSLSGNVSLPGGWSVTRDDEVDSIVDEAGATVGRVAVYSQTTCNDLVASVTRDETDVNTVAPLLDDWTGREINSAGWLHAVYCRPVVLPDRPQLAILVQGNTDVIVDLVTRVDAAAKRWVSRLERERTMADQTITFDTDALVVPISGAWVVERSTTGDDRFELVKDDGETHAWIRVELGGDCEVKKDAVKAEVTSALSIQGLDTFWTGVEWTNDAGELMWHTCRQQYSGRFIVEVRGQAHGVKPLMTKIEDAAWAANRAGKPSPKWFTILPDRWELGVALIDDGPQNTLDADNGVGASLCLERMLYGRGLPAWGYKMRLTPTTTGMAGYLEGAIGAAAKIASVQAVLGVGGAGEHAPWGPHAGFHAGLLVAPIGVELEGGYAWTSNGRLFRFEGRTVIGGERWGGSLGVGYELREGSRVLTIDFAGMRFP